jgi:hypothetical protein
LKELLTKLVCIEDIPRYNWVGYLWRMMINFGSSI